MAAMTHLLDAATCIAFLRSPDHGLADFVRRVGIDQVAVGSLVRIDLLEAAAASRDPTNARDEVERFLSIFGSLDFDDSAADRYVALRALPSHPESRLGHRDLMLAALALAHDLTLVTPDPTRFANLPRLRLEDWTLSRLLG